MIHLEFIKKHKLHLFNNTIHWDEPEWGFPKGRRNYKEKDLECALREFEEETGIQKSSLTIIKNLNPFEEIFTGSNLKSYKHKSTNKAQNTRVSKIQNRKKEVM